LNPYCFKAQVPVKSLCIESEKKFITFLHEKATLKSVSMILTKISPAVSTKFGVTLRVTLCDASYDGFVRCLVM
jgi:hypothetical protein